MKNTKIEWCDHTFNPWEGCTKVSPGCANCYAENRNARFGGGTAPNWGKGAPRRRTSVQNWNQPLKWDRDHAELVRCANLAGEHPPRRPRVFCASLADIFDDEVPIEWFADALVLAYRTENLNWLWLTKRPENFKSRVRAAADYILMQGGNDLHIRAWLYGQGTPANIWIGTTVENQEMADKRIPELLKIPARVRFLSCEPLLGPVDLLRAVGCSCGKHGCTHDLKHGNNYHIKDGIHWVICGGESGPRARPMHQHWPRSLRDQCKAAGVPFLFKQWGAWAPYNYGRDDVTKLLNPAALDTPLIHVGKARAGRLLDGVEHNEFPELKS